jgi:hypothetical protein
MGIQERRTFSCMETVSKETPNTKREYSLTCLKSKLKFSATVIALSVSKKLKKELAGLLDGKSSAFKILTHWKLHFVDLILENTPTFISILICFRRLGITFAKQLSNIVKLMINL